MNNLLKDRIIAIAKEKGITIRKLEQDLGYADKTVAKFDKHTPSVEKVKEIADYLCVSVDELLNDKEKDEELMDLREMLRKNPDAKILFDATKNATTEQINAVVEMIKAWKN